jgi:hypothetical protein
MLLSVFMCEHWQYWPKAMGTSRAALSLRRELRVG